MNGRSCGPGERVLRLLLSAGPRDFRDTRSEELLAHVREERREWAEHGRGALAGFWVRTWFDVLRTVLRLRFSPPALDFDSEPRSSRSTSMRNFVSELRPAARRLLATPGFTVIVVVSLGLGIGLSSAIFSVVDAVLLEPFAYRAASQLVQIEARWESNGIENVRLSGGEVKRIRDATKSYEDIAAVGSIRQNLTGGELPRQVQVGWVTPNLFELLGVSAAIGRTFTPGDPPGTALLDYDVWLSSFGGDPGIVGRTVHLDGYAYHVVGVLPRDFRLHLSGFAEQQDVWKVPDDWWQNGDVWSETGAAYGSFRLIGRLRAGVTVPVADAEVQGIGAEIARDVPEYRAVGYRLKVSSLRDPIVRGVRPTLLLFQGAVLLVLVIACANVVALMLARTQGRSREIGLRRALGSGRAGIVRLVLAEGLLLGLAAGLLGTWLAGVGVRGLAALRPPNLPRLEQIGVDGSVLAFVALVTLCCTMLFGLLPAWFAMRRAPLAGQAGMRATAGRERNPAGRALAVAQVALSVVLLIAAGLLARSMAHLTRVDPGFRAEDVLTFSVTLPGKRYERPAGTDRFLRELEQRLKALPGVRSAGVVWPLPLNGRVWSDDYEGGQVRADHRSLAEYRLATEGYFETLGIPLVEGRAFAATDAREVAMVSRSLAERAWPGQSVVGQRIRATPWGGAMVDMEVIGVVDDVRNAGLREPPRETIYFDSRGWSWTDWEVDVIVRTAGETTALVPAIRRLLAELDSEIPLARARSMTEYVQADLASNRLAVMLVGLFSVVAAVLAVVGLYGVISYWVGGRMREFGIRMALGSARGGVFKLVLARGVQITAAGLTLGLFAAFWLTRLLASLLYGVQPTDSLTFAAAAGTLAVVALLACYVPAWRATRADPVAVLHTD